MLQQCYDRIWGNTKKGQVPYLELALSDMISLYIKYLVFYLLRHMRWLMSATSGIELMTCFKNMPMQNVIPENITAAKAIVKIVAII